MKKLNKYIIFGLMTAMLCFPLSVSASGGIMQNDSEEEINISEFFVEGDPEGMKPDEPAGEGTKEPKGSPKEFAPIKEGENVKGFDSESLKGAEGGDLYNTQKELMETLKTTGIISAAVALICVLSYIFFFKNRILKDRDEYDYEKDYKKGEIE